MTLSTTKRPKRSCKPESLLLTATCASVIVGVALGVLIKTSDAQLTSKQHELLRFPGEIFLRMLTLLVIPLMFSSLVNSLANLETKTAGRLAFLGVAYYAMTIALAVSTGIAAVMLIQPGSASPRDRHIADVGKVCKGKGPTEAILDLIRNIFLDNVVEATFKSKSTCLKYTLMENGTSSVITYDNYVNLTTEAQNRVLIESERRETAGMNVLGIIVFALFFGGTLGRVGEPGKPLRKFFNAFEMVIMQLVSMAIWFAPIGIMCLIASEIAKMEDLGGEAKRLGMFVLTVMAGFAFHALITLQVILVFVARRNPFKFTYEVLQALLTAFATASSNATMPLTLKCLEENVKCDKRVTKFLIPLGATVNMNGTALYEAVASIYIAQCLGADLTIGNVIIISFTSVLASVGASGMPHAGMMTMIMVLIAIGLPPAYFALVVPVDWFIDRFRTAINVYDDMIACVIVDKYCKRSLMEEKEDTGGLPMVEGDPYLQKLQKKSGISAEDKLGHNIAINGAPMVGNSKYKISMDV
uniref:Amino acid transporter n=1 Tax=Romanomermis culicivorax TaxID=13658 RepID=A0A915K3V8_ROMCU